MIAAIITLGIIGIIAGAGLAIASKKFAVERNPLQTDVLALLPGTNCGACGFPGCVAMSAAIAEGRSAPNGCPSASAENAEMIAKLMGLTIVIGTKKVARLLCSGSCEFSAPVAVYDGPMDCDAMSLLSGGGKACAYGCMGGGSCEVACIYDALHMGVDGLPKIVEDKCTSCGLCVKACPRKLLKLIEIDKPIVVLCSSTDKGGDVRKICSVGCTGCTICAKNCPETAITVENFLAVIDPTKCTVCGICVEKCPQKTIKDLA
jgi:Na+-translocating ferredoxin:NAD+ oxidoreductase RNF subunit RnfB